MSYDEWLWFGYGRITQCRSVELPPRRNKEHLPQTAGSQPHGPLIFGGREGGELLLGGSLRLKALGCAIRETEGCVWSSGSGCSHSSPADTGKQQPDQEL